MSSILAIDAAWTAQQPSGVALLAEQDGRWTCAALAASYADFYKLAEGGEIDWSAKPDGESPDIDKLLASAEKLSANHPVSIITIDMPVSTVPISGRRQAEQAISQSFGAMGCAAHSPSSQRPGSITTAYTESCFKKGYKLGVTTTRAGTTNRLLEVYPHPALLRLMVKDYRLPYKAGKTTKYWRDYSAKERKEKLFNVYMDILNTLKKEIQTIPLDLPDDLVNRSFSDFKRYEDAIDALICGWVGMKYLSGEAEAYGDSTGAIWVPN